MHDLRVTSSFSRRREAALLSALLASAFGVVQLCRPTEPPPDGLFAFLDPTDASVAQRAMLALAGVPVGAVQYALHSHREALAALRSG